MTITTPNNGDIIHLNNYPVERRKTKFVLVIDNTEKWCFCINTDNRTSYNCFTIFKKDHAFLQNPEHYIACSNIIKYNQEDITKNTAN
jgi:hypothetical protein